MNMNEILFLKTLFSGVCGGDIRIQDNKFNLGYKHLPFVMGHEMSGEVYSLGDETEDGNILI